MNAEQAITQYQSDRHACVHEIAAMISAPTTRQAFYKALLNRALAPLRDLLLLLWQAEVAYRQALWDREEEEEDDDGDSHEGLYRCAFLLYRLGDPHDTLLLWKAKHINMDVGSSMGAEYFIGAGLPQTQLFLRQSPLEKSRDILAYVDAWFKDPDALEWQPDWEDERAANIRGAGISG